MELSGLKVILDIQHLYRPAHPDDHGTRFTLGDGTHIYEAAAATAYAQAAGHYLSVRGARVLTNDPVSGYLTGPYSRRHKTVNRFVPHAYLACHVNAGGGTYYLGGYTFGNGNGQRLSVAIGDAVSHELPAIYPPRTQGLVHGMRGAVCIAGVSEPTAAVLLEPFFGDRASHSSILTPPKVVRLGEAIGRGIASWWMRAQPVAAMMAAIPPPRS